MQEGGSKPLPKRWYCLGSEHRGGLRALSLSVTAEAAEDGRLTPVSRLTPRVRPQDLHFMPFSLGTAEVISGLEVSWQSHLVFCSAGKPKVPLERVHRGSPVNPQVAPAL